MKFDKIVLRGYIRIALNMIDSIEIDFNQPTTIILGCNGSGKTSIVGELIQLVGYHQDFKKNGYKTVHLSLNGSKYIVEADFSEKHPHKFYKDGENLNQGGTVTVQQELVKMHFGIDSDIVDLFLGRLTFTSMSPSKRKEMIMKMSGQVLDYALSAFDAAKVKTRDLKGALAHLRSRILEVSKTVDDLTTEVDMDRISAMQEEITKCTELMDPQVGVSDDFITFRDKALEHLAAIDEISKELIKHQVKSAALRHSLRSSINSELDLDDQIGKQDSKHHHLAETATNLMHEQDQITRDIIEKNAHGDAVQVANWKTEVKTLESDISALKSRVRLFEFKSLPSDTPPPQMVRDELVELLGNIPDNTDGRYSRLRLSQIKNDLMVFEKRRGDIETTLRKNRHALDTMREVKSSKCPKCNYVYKEGVTESDILRFEEIVSSDVKMIDSIKKQEEDLKEEANRIETYAYALNELIQLKTRYPVSNLLEHLIKDGVFNHSPSTTNPIVHTWCSDYEIAIAVRDKTAELERLNYKLSVAEQYVDKAMDDLTKRSRSLEDKAQEVQAEITLCKEYLSKLSTLRSLYRREDQLVTAAERHGRAMKEALELAVTVSKTQNLRQAVRMNNIELSSYKSKVEERNSAISVLDDMQTQVVKVEEDFYAYKLLTSLLSPIDGIIAKTVGGFLHHMCKQINETIASVFTYDLKVLVSSGDLLDYKFPLQSNAMDNPPKDVSMGSDGQKEIVNFAFKLVAMRQLGFAGFPLVLDEPGRTMDEEHQRNFMNYIKTIMDAHRHSQCLFISHFAFASGVFKDASYVVLNPSNITVPGNYNVDVKIT